MNVLGFSLRALYFRSCPNPSWVASALYTLPTKESGRSPPRSESTHRKADVDWKFLKTHALLPQAAPSTSGSMCPRSFGIPHKIQISKNHLRVNPRFLPAA